MAIQWRVVPPEEIEEAERNRCKSRRGRFGLDGYGKTRCEIDARHHPNFHAGRGERGQWFVWSSKYAPPKNEEE